MSAGSSFPGTAEPVVTCSKIEDMLYPDINVPNNAQIRFFRRVLGSSGTERYGSGTLTLLLEPTSSDNRSGVLPIKLSSFHFSKKNLLRIKSLHCDLEN